MTAGSNHRPLVIGHRGASGLAPENTLCAFRLALALGASGVELDVHLSADGHPVVIHDATVNRTTDGVGPVSGLSARQLAGLDAGAWFDRRIALRPRVLRTVREALASFDGGRVKFAGEPVPTLESALSLLAAAEPTRVYIELKGTRAAGPALLDVTLEVVRAARLDKAAVLLSFDHNIIRRAGELAPDVRTAINIPAIRGALPTSRSIIKSAERAAAAEVALHFSLASRRLVRTLHERGLQVAAWTANRKIVMRRLIACEVDSIITNFPNRLLAVVEPSKAAAQKDRRRASPPYR